MWPVGGPEAQELSAQELTGTAQELTVPVLPYCAIQLVV
jgi:hypothetical protein